jgi:bifunctional UDP-N-acetylglucosamine pyrophosphorylase / glucosamine-1-phosphate N-acetyltransferase
VVWGRGAWAARGVLFSPHDSRVKAFRYLAKTQRRAGHPCRTTGPARHVHSPDRTRPSHYDSAVKSPLVLVMAAGEGTRMRSSLPKMLHPVCGRPMIAWPILAAREAGAGRVAAIVSPGHDISAGFPGEVETVVQPRPDGTGGAVRAALPLIEEAETVLVLSGDHPLISAEPLAALLAAHASSGAAATMLTIELDDPGSYGRVVRDDEGRVERVVEAKAGGDASPEELAIREVNAGTYAFDAAPLALALRDLSSDNAQGEYYLTDVFAALREAGHAVAGHPTDDFAVTMGVNNRAELAAAEAEGRRRILEAHMLAGVTVVDPASTWIDADVTIVADARIEPGSSLRGATEVGAGSVVGPLSTLIDTRLGADVAVPHSYLVECEVLDGCSVGPFAYLRPGAHLEPGAKAGTFVEVKNSRIGAGAKVPHLAYVGDAEVGAGSNLGAGTITANYDGFRKHRTVIGEGARIGVDTMLIAPVQVGDAAYTGAGAVIKDDVPEGALAVSENDQRNIEGYAERRAARAQEEDS